MAEFQSIFRRYEQKYIINGGQRGELLKIAGGRIAEDKYPHCTICSIYYDTPSKILIRNSIEKPVYKEKLRLRSYGVPKENDEVFLELKKKFDGVVYKRRTAMNLRQAELFLGGKRNPTSQIEREIAWFISFYKDIEPSMFISCDRDSLCGTEDSSLRITFDSRPLAREEKLSFSDGIWGEKILDDGLYIMEIKSPYAIPLWLAHALNILGIFPTSFSKYGTGYQSFERKKTYAPDAYPQVKKFA